MDLSGSARAAHLFYPVRRGFRYSDPQRNVGDGELVTGFGAYKGIRVIELTEGITGRTQHGFWLTKAPTSSN